MKILILTPITLRYLKVIYCKIFIALYNFHLPHYKYKYHMANRLRNFMSCHPSCHHVIRLLFSMLRHIYIHTNEQHLDLQVCFADNFKMNYTVIVSTATNNSYVDIYYLLFLRSWTNSSVCFSRSSWLL